MVGRVGGSLFEKARCNSLLTDKLTVSPSALDSASAFFDRIDPYLREHDSPLIPCCQNHALQYAVVASHVYPRFLFTDQFRNPARHRLAQDKLDPLLGNNGPAGNGFVPIIPSEIILAPSESLPNS